MTMLVEANRIPTLGWHCTRRLPLIEVAEQRIRSEAKKLRFRRLMEL
jgi:hypothetical protein